MSNKLRISSRAFEDVEKKRDWYDEQSENAGARFMDELNLFLKTLIKYPQQYKRVSKNVRRCLMDIFPYIIYFTEDKGLVTILRIRHAKQRPLKRYR